jgi:hypothetical protein
MKEKMTTIEEKQQLKQPSNLQPSNLLLTPTLFFVDSIYREMFERYTVKELRMFLSHFKQHHSIKNYHRMKKEPLVDEMKKQFLTIRGSGNKNSGYVRRLEAENKIVFDKIHNPTKYMIKKYRNNQVVVQEEPEHPEPQYEEEQAPPPPPPPPPPRAPSTQRVVQTRPPPRTIFAPNEVLDFNVAREKPKKKRPPARVPTETEADKERQRQIEETNKDVERRVRLVGLYESLKKQIVELRLKLMRERSDYNKAYKELESRKGLRKQKKEEMLNEYSNAFEENIKAIKKGYPQVLKHIKDYKLDINDLNSVLIDVRKRMDRL